MGVSLTPGGDRGRKWDNVPAELALMGAVVLVLKLVYGLDGTERWANVCRVCDVPLTRPCRSVAAENDPGCAMPRLPDYLTSLVRSDGV